MTAKQILEALEQLVQLKRKQADTNMQDTSAFARGAAYAQNMVSDEIMDIIRAATE